MHIHVQCYSYNFLLPFTPPPLNSGTPVVSIVSSSVQANVRAEKIVAPTNGRHFFREKMARIDPAGQKAVRRGSREAEGHTHAGTPELQVQAAAQETREEDPGGAILTAIRDQHRGQQVQPLWYHDTSFHVSRYLLAIRRDSSASPTRRINRARNLTRPEARRMVLLR